MIRYYTQQELLNLSPHQLDVLENHLRHLLDDLVPDSTDADIIRNVLTAISNTRRLKRRRAPSP